MGPTKRKRQPSKSISSAEYTPSRMTTRNMGVAQVDEELQESTQGLLQGDITDDDTKPGVMDGPLDVESIEPEFVEDIDGVEIRQKEEIADAKPSRIKKRKSVPENINHNAVRYYDRYKNQEYVKRNDCAKYCQICKKKVYGKLRSLPSDHRLRRLWILRLNLDAERSSELWVREAFSDATHCGEACPVHFPVGTNHMKNRELLPLDMRHDPESYSTHEDEAFDFDSLELECVFCDAKSILRFMVPFSRTRNRRYKWINALTGDHDNRLKEVLQDRLKNGASKFLCDWHFRDEDFETNSYGEWRLKKDALPDPGLCESDKASNRIYMVNRGETVYSRSIDFRRPRKEDMILGDYRKARYDRDNYGYMAEKLRRTYPRVMYDRPTFNYDHVMHYDDEIDPEMGEVMMHDMYDDPDRVEDELEYQDEDGTITNVSRASELFTESVEVSDDSDEEVEALHKVAMNGDVGTARFCQVCSRVVSSEKSMKEFKPRTWPFDDVKHEKWLEIMNWPHEFEESMRVLWVKRRNDFVHNITYHFCPINICQTHLEYRHLHDKINEWLSTYCILCDEDLKDPNLVLPFPADRGDRMLWLHSLVSGPAINKPVEYRWKWLRERLTRPKSTRYRICVYHFSQDSFVEKADCVEFNEAAIPLSMGLSEYDTTPRGPQGLIKCPLCDMWGTDDQLTEIRPPASQAERILLVEMFSGDKPAMKRGVEQLAIHACKICKAHLPIMDPYTVIAERRLVGQLEVQCVQCNNRDVGANMVPFPWEEGDKKQHWIDALCRDHFTRSRLVKRLEIEGRHYLCTAHFHKNSLRYIPGLGVWKRFVYMPLAVTSSERDRLMRLQTGKSDVYHPLFITGLDDNGVVHEVAYDQVSAMLGEDMDSMMLLNQVDTRERVVHPMYHVANKVVKGVRAEERMVSYEGDDDEDDVRPGEEEIGELDAEDHEQIIEEIVEEECVTDEMENIVEIEGSESSMAFTFAALAYLIALLAVAFCIFFAIYTVICIDELKTDYKDPIVQCKNLNQLILPEYATHIVFTLLFILSGQIIASLMNLPLAIYHVVTYTRRPVMSGPGIYDPTTILNRNELSSALRASWVKLAFYLISFFYYLYALIYTLVTST